MLLPKIDTLKAKFKQEEHENEVFDCLWVVSKVCLKPFISSCPFEQNSEEPQNLFFQFKN